jgi:dienelactone hydrolase
MKFAAVLLLLSAIPAQAGLTENVPCTKDPTQTYTLYLPSHYSTERKWPVLFIFDPRSRGTQAAEIFRGAAEEYGWILLSSNNTRSDTGWEVNERAVQAMLPELGKYSVNPSRIYAAGFSGGATVAFLLARMRHFAGVINSGQPWMQELDATKTLFAVWSSTGKYDFNNVDVRRIDADVAESGSPHHVEVFDGVHQWMPEPLAREAIEWHELIAMHHGDVDAVFVQRMFDEAMKRAAAEKDLAALQRYEAIVRDFTGIHDVADAARAAASLKESKTVRQQIREQRSADDYEKREISNLIGRLREALADPPGLSSLDRQLGLRRIIDAAAQQDAHGLAARRALETLFVQCGFYLPQQYFAAHDYEKAAIVLTVAAAVKSDRPNVQYDLARALARTGRAKEAIASLERAVQLAPRNAEAARTEADFETLRKLPRFEEIIR